MNKMLRFILQILLSRKIVTANKVFERVGYDIIVVVGGGLQFSFYFDSQNAKILIALVYEERSRMVPPYEY